MSHKPLDLENLTLGEVATIEDLSGLPLAAFADDNKPKGKAIAALVFVQSRRLAEPKDFPTCLAMNVTEATAYVGLDDDEETDAGDTTPAQVEEYRPTETAADPS